MNPQTKSFKLHHIITIGVVLSILCLLYLFSTCEPNHNPSLAIDKSNITIDSLKNQLRLNDKKFDSLKLKSDWHELKYNLHLANFKKVAPQVQKNKTDFKNLIQSDNGEIAIYYGKRYNLPNDAITTPNGTQISDSLAYLNISELFDLDGCKEENRFLGLMLKERDSSVTIFNNLLKVAEKSKNDTNLMYLASENKYNEMVKAFQNQKEVKFRLLGGVGGGVDKNFNQFAYKLNLGFQNKKGTAYLGSFMQIGTNQYYLFDVNACLFSIKGKKS